MLTEMMRGSAAYKLIIVVGINPQVDLFATESITLIATSVPPNFDSEAVGVIAMILD